MRYKFGWILLLSCMLLSISACKISFQKHLSIGGEITPVDTSDIVPLLTEVTAVASGKLSTPSYTFHSNKTGSLIYGGSCSSAVSQAVVGNNTITLTALSPGQYNDCTLQLADNDGMSSNVLALSSFIIDNPMGFTGFAPFAGMEIVGTENTYVKLSGFEWGNVSVEFNGSVLPLVEHTPYNLVVSLPSLVTGSFELSFKNEYGQISLPIAYKQAVSIQDFAAGNEHACLVRNTGSVACWGVNNYGQLGNSSTSSSSSLVDVTGITNAIKVGIGQSHSCVVLVDGSVRCWGRNQLRQLGDGSTTTQISPVVVSGVNNAVDVKLGDTKSCALLADESVVCWGDNQAVAETVISSGVVALDVAGNMACAVMASGEVQCWGQSTYGLGDGTNNFSAIPVMVSGINTASSISVGEKHSCIVSTQHELYCWGSNADGQLAKAIAQSSEPVLANITQVQNVAVGVGHTCVMKQDGSAACWGRNTTGQLGDNTLDLTSDPVAVADLPVIYTIYAAEQYSCAQSVSNKLICWGYIPREGSFTITSSMSLGLSDIADVDVLVAGDGHYCALKQNDDVICWGSNDYGQLGSGKRSCDSLNNAADARSVKPNVAMSDAKALAAGGRHSCAVNNSGAVYCWGYNNAGQLGDGTLTDRLQAVAVNNISQAIAVSAGDRHSCAVLNDGAVQCWGSNAQGQLGNNSTLISEIPVDVLGLPTIQSVSLGTDHSCALSTDGKIYCWGSNAQGQLGVAGGNQLVPVQVSGITNAVMISAGNQHTCALLQTHTVTCWGANAKGQLGNGNNNAFNTPQSVTGLTDVVAISVGNNVSCAVKQDKTVSCWGEDSSGRVGGEGDQNMPRAIFTAPYVEGVAISEKEACMQLQGGYVSCWGELSEFNHRGVLYKESVY